MYAPVHTSLSLVGGLRRKVEIEIKASRYVVKGADWFRDDTEWL